jgi:hypothetical protein
MIPFSYIYLKFEEPLNNSRILSLLTLYILVGAALAAKGGITGYRG